MVLLVGETVMIGCDYAEIIVELQALGAGFHASNIILT